MSDFKTVVEDLLKKLSGIEELCKGARSEIEDSLKKDDCSKEFKTNIVEKLKNIVNSIDKEMQETNNSINTELEINSSQDEKTGNKENETENSLEWKPKLKIVDFSKLVDPRNLELMDKNHKKKLQDKALSVIILSSSDDEDLPITRINNRSKKETLKTTAKRKPAPIIIKSKTESLKKCAENTLVHEQFQKKLCVNLLRVPCEEMKSFYAKKSENNPKSRKSSESFLDETTGLIIGCSSRSSDEMPLINNKTKTDTSTNKPKNIKLELKANSNDAKTSDSENPSKKSSEAKKKITQSSLSMKTNSAEASKNDDEVLQNRITTRRRRAIVEKSKYEISLDEDSDMKSLSKKTKDSSDKRKKLNESPSIQKQTSGAKETGGKSAENLVPSEEENEVSSQLKKTNEKEESDKNEHSNKQEDSPPTKDNSDSAENEQEKQDEVTNKTTEDKASDKSSEKNNITDNDKPDNIENGKKPDASQANSEQDMFKDAEEADIQQNNNGDNSSILSSDNEDTPAKTTGNSADSDNENKQNSDSNDSEVFTLCKEKSTLKSKKKRVKGLISDSDAENVEKTDDDDDDDDKNESEEKDDGSSNEEKDKERRAKKRIIQKNDSSSDSDSKSTRKKIKKVISKSSLSDSTKKAAAEERERKQRILEKQQKYNQIYENLDLENSKVEKLILDVDDKTGKPLVEVDKHLVSKLKPHQASGIQFMWDACFESLERTKNSAGSGCILAHCMGLGKTLQVITLVNTLLEHEKTNIKKVLIVCPLSTVINWKNEFSNWLSGNEDYQVYEMASCRTSNADRSHFIKNWLQNGGVLIMSYAMFRNLSSDANKRVNKKFRDIFAQGLLDPGPDIVICDEGHLLKNEKTSLSVSMNKIKTRRRIVLTGTPLQNNLKEYYCMVQFVKPNLLGTYKEYLNRFVNPISNGQYTDSTQYDIDIMRRRSHVLHKLLDGIVQRRDYSVLAPYLPPKHEYVLFLTLSEVQHKLYAYYMEKFAKGSANDSGNRASFLFQDYQNLSRICIHPRVLLDKSTEDQLKYKSDDEDDSGGSLKDFIDDEDSTSSSSSSESKSSSDSAALLRNKKQKKRVGRVTRAQKANKNSDESEEEVMQTEKEWWQEFCDGEELDNIVHSTKLLVLFEILKECEQIGDKVLVFSQSLYALNVIEYFLGKIDEATQNGETDTKTCGFSGSWTLGLDYFRLDGSTNCALRATWCDNFNRESNTRARLFLLSTKAGGLGINLVAANRVIIFDVSWNPSSDLQSIYRVYRFGQLKPSYVYRFVIYGTMEMKIYERQVTKQAISKRVIDEQQIDRHYNQNDLTELYRYEVASLEERPIPMVPKDVLLGELLCSQEKIIFKYHEHQSLLENKVDETLNEEERKAAWDEFENEKVERTRQNALIGKFSVTTVQLALKSLVQKDNPTWNNNQILSIIPQLTQQLNAQLLLGDFNMYNRIAAEIKRMQEEYARKIQFQYQQQRMNLAAAQGMMSYPNPFSNLQTPQMNLFQQLLLSNNNPNAGPSRVNTNNVIELN